MTTAHRTLRLQPTSVGLPNEPIGVPCVCGETYLFVVVAPLNAEGTRRIQKPARCGRCRFESEHLHVCVESLGLIARITLAIIPAAIPPVADLDPDRRNYAGDSGTLHLKGTRISVAPDGESMLTRAVFGRVWSAHFVDRLGLNPRIVLTGHPNFHETTA